MSLLPTSDIGAVAGAVAALGGIVLLLLRGRQAKQEKANEPIEQNRARKQVIGSEIGRDDERGANASLDDDLRRLRELEGSGDQSGQNSSAGPSGGSDQPKG